MHHNDEKMAPASFRPALYKQIIFTVYRFKFPTNNIADLCVVFSGDTVLQV